jgi:flagellar basal-body rod protein FlgG
MIRALYTAASGMNAQQQNIDNVAHNLANVNTTGFKKSRVEFEDLVYQQTRAAGSATSTTDEAPVGLDVGLGAKPVANARDFSTGNLRATNGPLDIAIEGRGFFKITLPSGETGYTRAGMFHLNAEGQVVSPEGFQLDPALTIPANSLTITVSRDGMVSALVAGENAPQQVGTLELAVFQNPAGLFARGGNIFTATTASGEPTTGTPGQDGIGTLTQGFLEESNVSVVEEMVKMIVGQRAYEANSKVVRAADEMLAQVNNMAR